MIEAVIRGMDGTVAVTSRSAYSLRSSGAISPVWPIIAQPTSRSTWSNRSSEMRVRKPGIDSSLSSVPPV